MRLLFLQSICLLLCYTSVPAKPLEDYYQRKIQRKFEADLFKIEISHIAALEIYQVAIRNDLDHLGTNIQKYSSQAGQCAVSKEENTRCQERLLEIAATLKNINKNIDIFNERSQHFFKQGVLTSSPVKIEKLDYEGLAKKIDEELQKNQALRKDLYVAEFDALGFSLFKDTSSRCNSELLNRLKKLNQSKLIPAQQARRRGEFLRLFSLRDSAIQEIEAMESSAYSCGIVTPEIRGFFQQQKDLALAEKAKDLVSFRVSCRNLNMLGSTPLACDTPAPGILLLHAVERGL